MINIAIINKHENDRKNIVTLLAEQNDFRMVSIGMDGYDAIKSAMIHRPDIVIMDFNLDDINSLDLAPIIKRNSPASALIVLCSHKERDAVGKVLKAGISGCLLQEEVHSNLVATIRSVFHGGLYISKPIKTQALNSFLVQGVSRKMANDVFETCPQLFPHCFSPTELQIFNGIIDGQTDKEIAKNLNMVTGSLRNCINVVKKKTGLRNRTQIAVYALLSGTINMEKIKENLLEGNTVIQRKLGV